MILHRDDGAEVNATHFFYTYMQVLSLWRLLVLYKTNVLAIS